MRQSGLDFRQTRWPDWVRLFFKAAVPCQGPVLGMQSAQGVVALSMKAPSETPPVPEAEKVRRVLYVLYVGFVIVPVIVAMCQHQARLQK